MPSAALLALLTCVCLAPAKTAKHAGDAPKIQANYRAGKLHGAYRESAGGQLVKEEFWIDGQLIIPKSREIITRELAAIQKMPIKTVGEFPRVSPRIQPALQDPVLQTQREAALRLLMSYRFLCDVPYKDLVLDRTYTAHAEAASDIMTRLDKMTHTPENPGMPEDEYRFAYKGTSSSNIFSDASLMKAVKSFMDDSDPKNIDRLGHRRWCLNPAMLKTGFGGGGKMSAMWSFDSSRKPVPDYDFVAFPPRGLTPCASFLPSYAWSISLNPGKHQKPDEKAVKVRVLPARFNAKSAAIEKSPQAVPLDYFLVSTEGFGIPNCIIFRPAGVIASPGAAYWVEVTGVKTRTGEDAKVEYLVVFVAIVA